MDFFASKETRASLKTRLIFIAVAVIAGLIMDIGYHYFFEDETLSMLEIGKSSIKKLILFTFVSYFFLKKKLI